MGAKELRVHATLSRGMDRGAKQMGFSAAGRTPQKKHAIAFLQDRSQSEQDRGIATRMIIIESRLGRGREFQNQLFHGR